MRRKNLGFTLAEVLIVIGIIGVVAALTLPNLNHATGDKERITKVKKIYSTLNEAFDRAQVVYGDASGWRDYAIKDGEETGQESNNLFINRIAEFMKVSKSNDNDGEITITLTDGLEFVIADTHLKGASVHYIGKNFLGRIYADIDGFNNGKNEYGYDRFTFDITDQGIYPEGIYDENISCLFNAENCECSGHYGATRWILENDNADYLKVNDAGKCNDSDIVLNWTTNTSCH